MAVNARSGRRMMLGPSTAQLAIDIREYKRDQANVERERERSVSRTMQLAVLVRSDLITCAAALSGTPSQRSDTNGILFNEKLRHIVLPALPYV
ncbi:hypothetical protein ACLOJK_010519 [Asimina triloba]